MTLEERLQEAANRWTDDLRGKTVQSVHIEVRLDEGDRVYLMFMTFTDGHQVEIGLPPNWL